MMTPSIHLVLVRGFSPLLYFILLSGNLFLNKHNSCLAIRFSGESDISEWDRLVNNDAAEKRLIAVKEHPSEYLRRLDSLDRNTRISSKTILSDDEEIERLSRLNEDHASHNSWPVKAAVERTARLQMDSNIDNSERKKRRNDALFLVIVGTSSLVGVLGLVAAAIFWYKIQKKAEAALDSEYPSYGVTGPGSSGGRNSPSPANLDRKLAHSAQMFHYQQQRQQMMAQEKTNLETKPVHSEDSDDEAPNNGDYTVYECPGLAPTGEMEVRNPLFAEPDSSLTSHPATNNHYPQPTSSSPPKEKSLS